MVKERNTSKYHLDGVPPLKESVPLGLQHFISMIAGNMVPAILISNIVGLDKQTSTMLMQGAMLVAGIATLLQLYPIPLFKGHRVGSRLPLIMGTNYVFLGACLSVVSKYGIPAMLGGQIGGAIIVFFAAFGVKKIKRFFTPIISGTIITCMGISLIPTAIKNLAGGEGSTTFGDPVNFLVGGLVALITVILMKYGKGLLKEAAILVGIIVGYVVSVGFGIVDFAAVGESSIFALPKILAFGVEFRLELVLLFGILYIIAMADMMGVITVATVGAMDREVTDIELESAVMGSAVGTVIASLFSSIPTGVFGQNTAMVAIDKVISRFVFSVAGVLLIIVGLSPFLGALMTTIPSCIIGGTTVVVFSSILMAGCSIISMDGFTEDNKFIAGISITVGIGLTTVENVLGKLPETVQILVGDSCIVSAFVIAILLKYILSKKANKLKKANEVN